MSKQKYMNLKWKYAIMFLFGSLLLGGIIALQLYFYLSDTLEQELINTSRMIALSIEEPVAENLFKEDIVALKDMVEKYKSFENVDYLIVEKYDREKIADTFIEGVPEELKSANTSDNLDEIGTYNTAIVNVPSMGTEFVDIMIPVKEGDLGFIRIGTDKKYIDDKVLATIYYTLSVIAILTSIWVIIGIIVVNLQITKPIKYLAEMAEKISLGDFNTPIQISAKNEIGELADAIERMRESLKAAIDRLRKRQIRKI